jgi:D-glycero-alpha-D-manno-heptose-7-phosphate kinase
MGGGSDLPSYYTRHGGAVISAAIDKYVYINVNERFEPGIRLGYSKTENVQKVQDIEHKIVRSVLEKLGINSHIEITSIADVPSRGTGMGSSSSFTVGLLHALRAYGGESPQKKSLGAEACYVEIEMCREPIGKQDQYAAAVGGFNMIKFNQDDSVTTEPVNLSEIFLHSLEKSMMLFYTGTTRSASEMLRVQSAILETQSEKSAQLQKLVGMAYDFRDAVQRENIEELGALLNEGWHIKKSITNHISSNEVDEMYSKALMAGAYGGKLLGAGGGGFLLITAMPCKHAAIKQALAGYRCMSFRFDFQGTTVVYKS